MANKLSQYCEGVIEAAWLAAVILVPLFFNIYSSRIFEPDKLALLRSLALLILAAWGIKTLSEGGIHWEGLKPGYSPIKFITKFPMLAPALALGAVYLLSTIFSVTPRTSLWGSYQRLQGTYTTLSYLVIFAAILMNLRRREQVERLITTIVLSSLPVVLYGILQRYKLDPIPWGGDTSVRIAANMGNSIFVAAYLIMVFPLTVGRIVEAFRAILNDEGSIWGQMARAVVYVFTAAVQIIALYMSGSRGPALGWMAGSFFLFLLLSLYWRKRWLTIGTIAAAFLMGVFLIVFNIENGPLESLRASPAIGRFGLLLNPQSNSALVRKYIWQGAAKLVGFHEPLEYPDGRKDIFNFMRPLIGYGPESMYVAYSPFYVPELAIVERRNASPDRSHNETWDALVITGVLGLLVYLALFTLVFYYGLKWIGLITETRHRNLYLVMLFGGGLIGAAGLSLWRGFEYFGVGLPFGMLIGLLGYITFVALFATSRSPETSGESTRSLTIMVLVAAIVSHFVEINFGIAIAATRTYFWVYTGLLVVIGYLLPIYEEHEYIEQKGSEQKPTMLSRESKTRKKRLVRRATILPENERSRGISEDLISSFVMALVLVTLGFDFIANSRGIKSGLELLWSSFTRLPNQNNALSYGLLALILTTWIFMGVVWASENTGGRSWWKRFAFISGGSLSSALIYWLWHAGNLARMARFSAANMADVLYQVGRYEGLLSRYYLAVLLLVLVLGIVLRRRGAESLGRFSTVGIAAAPLVLLLVIFLIFYTNLRVIQADIVFKIAEPFARSGQWLPAIAIYNRANALVPQEDYYYLFLGRAYLEHAKTISDATERDRFIAEAEADLKKAQSLNPLNTDHTANLARLYSLWASYATDEQTRERRGQVSSEYFAKATTLSPNNALLWDEWAYLFLGVLDSPEEAYRKLVHALEIDLKYHKTYALLGEYYSRLSRSANQPQEKQEALQKAAQYYAQALALPAPAEPQAHYNYALALGGTYVQLGRHKDAIEAYQQALKLAPSDGESWQIEEAIANLYEQIGDIPSAAVHVQNALNMAPQDQRDRLVSLLKRLQGQGQP